MKIKIQSISDIITNSSSETFTMLYDSSIDDVKNIIDSILALAGHGFCWDDFFDIYEDFNEEDAKWKHQLYWNRNHEKEEEYKEPTREELLDFVHEWNDELRDCDDFYIETYITVKSTSPDSVHAANLLSKLNSLFWYESFYNG